MQEAPSGELVELLERLGLAGRDQFLSVRARARRMARGLPLFESVWIDALAESGVLTPYQARQINAGVGDSLRIGRYTILQPGRRFGYAEVYEAREVDTQNVVRLAVATMPAAQADTIERKLRGVIEKSSLLQGWGLLLINDAGVEMKEPARVWAVSPACEATSAADLMTASGRLPPAAVLEVARQLAEGMANLEHWDLLHADLSASALLIGEEGRAWLSHPGVRPILRPEEGYGLADLAPEAYDYLAPERVEGAPADTATEMFAFGCLMWQLATGRPPLGGGDSLGKLQSAQQADVPGLHELAPDVCGLLDAVVAECTRRDAQERPPSFAELANRLGSPTPKGRSVLGAHVRHKDLPPWLLRAPREPVVPANKRVACGIAVSLCLAVVGVAFSLWGLSEPKPATSTVPVAKSDAMTKEPAQPADSKAAASSKEDSKFVALVSYQRETTEDVLELPGGKSVAAESLQLRPGVIVRGSSQARSRIVVPSGGFSVEAPDVQFENVDFVMSSSVAPGYRGAMIILAADWIAFHGCTFRTRKRGVTAIACSSTNAVPREIIVEECLFTGVSAALNAAASHSLTAEFSQCLLVETGNLVRLQHWPTAQAPLEIKISQVTLRGGQGVITCGSDKLPTSPGPVNVVSSNSVFAFDSRGSILRFDGAEDPEKLLRLLRWLGHGSLMARGDRFAVWVQGDDESQVLDASQMSIEGLIHSEMEFAGPASFTPTDSRLTRWSAPLRGAIAPGIDAARLR